MEAWQGRASFQCLVSRMQKRSALPLWSLGDRSGNACGHCGVVTSGIVVSWHDSRTPTRSQDREWRWTRCSSPSVEPSLVDLSPCNWWDLAAERALSRSGGPPLHPPHTCLPGEPQESRVHSARWHYGEPSRSLEVGPPRRRSPAQPQWKGQGRKSKDVRVRALLLHLLCCPADVGTHSKPLCWVSPTGLNVRVACSRPRDEEPIAIRTGFDPK